MKYCNICIYIKAVHIYVHEVNKLGFCPTGPHTEFTHFPRHALKVEIRNYDANFMITHNTTCLFL